MVTEQCERLWEVDAFRERRLGAKDVESFERHLHACAACRARMAEDERLRALGLRLEPPEASELDARRVRSAILKGAAGPRPRGRAWVAGLAAAAVLLAVATWGALRGATPAELAEVAAPSATPAPVDFAGTVAPAPDARWERERAAGVERVRLTEGSLALSVRHQRDVERFVVTMPDGEIEVRGTAFDVEVHGGKTSRVAVREGLVALRLDGKDEILLRAGDAWPTDRPTTPTPTSSSTIASIALPALSAPRRLPAASSTPPDVPERDDYARAIALYKAHEYKDAAALFHALAASGAHAEDAAFLEASSLAFAGNASGAAAAATAFLSRFPASFRAREAAILVARAARDRGDCAGARRALERWTSEPASADVQRALGSCAP